MAAESELITFGTSTCAPGWSAPNPGLARFRLVNDSSRPATVYLFSAASGAIVATAADIAAERTRTLTVRLTGGAYYAWSCDLSGYPVHVSDTERVALVGQAGGPGPKGVPIQADQLVAPLQSYRTYATRQLTVLHAQLTSLATDIASADLDQAEAGWLQAHLTWLSIGQDDGAYGAFADLGQQIDGMATAHALGTASPGFTGFHKVELDLFSDDDLRAAAGDTVKLQSLVDEISPTLLASDTPTDTSGLTNFTLRAHEVLEDAMRDSLTDDDDYGSGTDVASLTADIAATREFLSLLAPLLAPRSPYLVARAERGLSALAAEATTTAVDGRWVSVRDLPSRQREQLDADAGAVLETLAPIPDILALGAT